MGHSSPSGSMEIRKGGKVQRTSNPVMTGLFKMMHTMKQPGSTGLKYSRDSSGMDIYSDESKGGAAPAPAPKLGSQAPARVSGGLGGPARSGKRISKSGGGINIGGMV